DGDVYELCRSCSTHQSRGDASRRGSTARRPDGRIARAFGGSSFQRSRRDLRMDGTGDSGVCRDGLRFARSSWDAGPRSRGGRAMTPVKGGYAVDVPVINVSERARREHATVLSTFRAFGVTLRRLFTSLFKGDTPTIYYPEQTRPYSERFRGTHILTVR